MRSRRFLVRVAGAGLLVLGMGAGCAGQITGVTTNGAQQVDASTQGAVGLNPVRVSLDYSVDPATGMLGIRIRFPLPVGSRGPNLGYLLTYSSSQGHPQLERYRSQQPQYLYSWQSSGSGSWQAGTPTLSASNASYSGLDANGSPASCQESGPYIFTDSNGESHDLGLVHVAYSDPYAASLCPDNEADTATATDDDSLYAALAWNSGVTVTQADGTRYFFTGPTSGGTIPLTQVEDANGNRETISVAGGVETWTDATGRRALVVDYQAVGRPAWIETFDSAGNAHTYTFTWSSVSFAYAVNDPNDGNCPYVGNCEVDPNVAGSEPELSSLELPDGSSYSFAYDPTYGAVSRITLPTGGGAGFAYGLTPLYEQFGYLDANGGAALVYDDLAVTQETRSDGGSWRYSYASAGSGTWSSKTTTITDPGGNTTALTYLPTVLTGSAGGGANYSLRGLEVQRVVSNAQGARLRTVTTNYTGIKPHQVQTALDDGGSDPPTAEVDDTWGPGQDIVEEDAHDYVACPAAAAPAYASQPLACAAGPLLRKTARTFLNYTTGAPWIVDKATSEVVSDGSGATLAQTATTYDAYPNGLQASNATQHDPAYAGSGYSARGNATSVARWVSGGTWLTTQYAYDDAGNRVETLDPNNNPTYYSYADSWANAACAPAGGAADSFLTRVTNALGQTTSATYNSCSGTLATRTDANGQTWGWSYDLLNRAVQATYPDGGVTNTSYTDTPGAFTVETQRKMDGSHWTDAWEAYDGLGREVVASAANGEATPWDREDTCYDGEGRVIFKSYPYQGSSGTAGANCAGTGDSFTYDALGRPTLTTHSDGTTFITSYAGRATETEDEGNGTSRVTKITQSDGLGNLASVCEVTSATLLGPGGAPTLCGQDINLQGFLTSYTHDALGNLTGVNQGALAARSFSYDGLSRLLSANNPESGVTSYTYDGDSNVLTRTRPAPNQPLATDTLTTTYTWDALDRLLSKTYSDGSPAVDFEYDMYSSWGVGLNNPIGRLGEEWTNVTGMGAASIFSYDAMGRVNQVYEAMPDNLGQASPGYTYGYNLAGEMVSSAYRYGATLTMGYNVAGRPTSLASSASGTLLSGISYDARGEEASATLGSGLAESRGYDARGRASSIQAGGAYSFGSTSYAPDGDLLGSSDSANGTFTYAFNDLNQLAQACTPDCAGNMANFAYDRYGSRWSGGPEPLSFYDGNNRMDANPPYQYDAAGNLLNDGAHSYLYDAENRLVSVDGGATASYIYDAEGKRVHEDVGGVVKEYVYGAGGQETIVVDGSGNLEGAETYVGGRYVGTQTPSGFVYSHTDNVGTVRVRTDAAGNTVESDTSWPFGAYLNQVGAISNQHYTGKYRDGESGLDYFGARYYSSQLGRFLTPDWSEDPEPVPYADLSDPQSLNLYAYAGNNPVTNTDADGHLCCFDFSTTAWGQALAGESVALAQNAFNAASGFFAYADYEIALGRAKANQAAAAAHAASTVAESAVNWYGQHWGCQGVQVCQSGIPEGEVLETLQEILSSAAREGGSSSKILAKTGGIEQAAKDFEALPGQAEAKGGGVTVKQMPDGTKAILRGSSDGRQTIEIQHAGGGVTKIRYGSGQ